nr:hypothetical protein [Kibdelosporangium sp. MJ126-NF4]CTQ95422.1 hypothetical protein [Kibdelosporangium sp. MJ126-NF4]
MEPLPDASAARTAKTYPRAILQVWQPGAPHRATVTEVTGSPLFGHPSSSAV